MDIIDTGSQGGFPEKVSADDDVTTGTTTGTTPGTTTIGATDETTTTGDGHPPRASE